MDGCKLIIEYEVDCTFKFSEIDTGKGDIITVDKEIEKGKINILLCRTVRHSPYITYII